MVSMVRCWTISREVKVDQRGKDAGEDLLSFDSSITMTKDGHAMAENKEFQRALVYQPGRISSRLALRATLRTDSSFCRAQTTFVTGLRAI